MRCINSKKVHDAVGCGFFLGVRRVVGLAYHVGRIHAHKVRKYFTSKKEGDVLMDINMSAFDRIYGKRKKQKDG